MWINDETAYKVTYLKAPAYAQNTHIDTGVLAIWLIRPLIWGLRLVGPIMGVK